MEGGFSNDGQVFDDDDDDDLLSFLPPTHSRLVVVFWRHQRGKSERVSPRDTRQPDCHSPEELLTYYCLFGFFALVLVRFLLLFFFGDHIPASRSSAVSN